MSAVIQIAVRSGLSMRIFRMHIYRSGLSDAREAKKRVDSCIAPPRTPNEQQERWKRIEIENVRLQVENLLTFPLVKKAAIDGEIKIYGLSCDLSTGLLSRDRVKGIDSAIPVDVLFFG